MGKAQIGVYGLGTMGSALALNLAQNGFDVAVTNRETEWIAPFMTESGSLADRLIPSETLGDFVASLARPRAVLFMIPSGAPMDAMLDDICPMLDPGDTLIDAGNADFNDTRRRVAALDGTGLHYVGMGVSGGEDGARHGPSMMFGGSTESWAHLCDMLQAMAAKFEGDPCVARVGPDGAGHFVKTVHNGIEYADMQMIAEIYGVLRDGAGHSAEQIGTLFTGWNDGPLASFLIEITGRALMVKDPDTGAPLSDMILDKAGQKGTGRWTVIEALKLGQSANAIEAAVGARAWSAEKPTRELAETLLDPAITQTAVPDAQALHDALLAGRILAHAQGFRVLSEASDAFDWSLDLARIAEIWRAGCIIRSALLDDVSSALHAAPPQGHLLLAPALRDTLAQTIPALRKVVSASASAGWPVPALAASLSWYDTMRLARGTTNLIQTQRDAFGAHGFERVDKPGKFGGDWT
ncbi:MAG: NADP-dependent phosphogluconate dehydrogenase [Sedimentitalea sp.]